ncbi:hypothetical protein QFZ99_002910 [Paraburkholderia atlantica]|uniref:hypothetical protein n=1 Tax=Paraburkholderia atlantica TaxID=2654982 RepID=UPI003D1EC402
MTKVRLAVITALLTSVWSAAAVAQTAQPAPTFVTGSDTHDFQIRCQQNGKLTMGIFNRNNTSDYQVARYISYIQLGNGKYGLDFMRGFTSATEHEVYFPANDESCEVTQR